MIRVIPFMSLTVLFVALGGICDFLAVGTGALAVVLAHDAWVYRGGAKRR